MENIVKRFCLIGKINGLAAESKRTRQRLLKSKSDKVLWKLSYRKYIVGLDIRHHLLAYAFLRGTPYHKLEQRCRPEALPKSDAILQIVMEHAPFRVNVDLEKINAWIKGGV